MKKYTILILFLLLILVAPAFALTPPYSIEAHIASLRSQIADLTVRLNQLLAEQNQNSFCYDFNQDLKYGNTGGENLKNLQRVLFVDGVTIYSGKDFNLGIFEYNPGYIPTFGPDTFSFVKKFQSKYGIPATGYVGPLTRAKLNELYGCKNKVFITPEVLPEGGIGEGYSINLQAHGLGSDKLKWSIISGALPVGLELDAPPIFCVDFEHSPGYCSPKEYQRISGYPSAAGVYNFTVKAVNGTATATKTYILTVKGQETATSTITVLSPNGGETWVASSTQPIKWNWPGAKRTNKVDLYLVKTLLCVNTDSTQACNLGGAPVVYVLDKNIRATATYNWIVASEMGSNEITIPAGQYRVRVCEAGTEKCDSSDQAFTIANAEISGIYGRITFTQGNCMPTVVLPGASSTPSSCRSEGVAREILIYPPVRHADRDKLDSYKLITSTKSDNNGNYSLALSPGNYSVFVKESGSKLCGLSSDSVECPVKVEVAKQTIYDIDINYLAAY